jgi:hypothetical protein
MAPRGRRKKAALGGLPLDIWSHALAAEGKNIWRYFVTLSTSGSRSSSR